MKKTILLALMGFMLFAFTQCGSGESKEFKDFQKALNEFESQVNKAKSCDDLIAAEVAFGKCQWANTDYDEKDQMTEDETTKAKEMLKKAQKLADDREDELCDLSDLFNGLKDSYNDAIDDLKDTWDDIGDDLDDALDDLDDALDDLDEALDDWGESMDGLFD